MASFSFVYVVRKWFWVYLFEMGRVGLLCLRPISCEGFSFVSFWCFRLFICWEGGVEFPFPFFLYVSRILSFFCGDVLYRISLFLFSVAICHAKPLIATVVSFRFGLFLYVVRYFE